jgi:hypothetical protein
MRLSWCMLSLTSVRASEDGPDWCADGLSRRPPVADSALEIVDAHQRKIVDLQYQVLLKPTMKAVRQRECGGRIQ